MCNKQYTCYHSFTTANKALTNLHNVHLRGTERNMTIWERINSLIFKPFWIYIFVILQFIEEQIDMLVFMFFYFVVFL
jgi:hypothetical protein